MVSPPAMWDCLPEVGMAEPRPGRSRPGSRLCQYTDWNRSLPRWLSRDSLSSGRPTRGEVAGQRLGVVVEVDEQGLVEPGLDEAVGVPVETGLERLAGEEPAHVADERLALEVGDRTGLGRRHVGGVTDDEDVRCGLRLQGVLVGGNEVELVAQAR